MKLTRNSTLIILDWDDTLFPTSWLVKNGINMNNEKDRDKVKNQLLELDTVLSKLLLTLKKYGTVVIVTNALPEWVKISSAPLEKTKEIMIDIKVISARKIYQKVSDSTMDWKKKAFTDEVSKRMRDININNIISIGDAEYEYQALIGLYKSDKNNYKILKSVKFVRDPPYGTLLDQIKVVRTAIPNICTKTTHLDLKFENFKKN